jgi:hypothetical protein
LGEMRSIRLATVMAGSMDTAMRWLLGINTYTVHGGGGGDDGNGDDDVVLMAVDASTAPSVMQRYYRCVSNAVMLQMLLSSRFHDCSILILSRIQCNFLGYSFS